MLGKLSRVISDINGWMGRWPICTSFVRFRHDEVIDSGCSFEWVRRVPDFGWLFRTILHPKEFSIEFLRRAIWTRSSKKLSTWKRQEIAGQQMKRAFMYICIFRAVPISPLFFLGGGCFWATCPILTVSVRDEWEAFMSEMKESGLVAPTNCCVLWCL